MGWPSINVSYKTNLFLVLLVLPPSRRPGIIKIIIPRSTRRNRPPPERHHERIGRNQFILHVRLKSCNSAERHVVSETILKIPHVRTTTINNSARCRVKDGKNITLSSEKYGGGNVIVPSLLIKNITREDMGEYACICENSIGSEISDDTIYVNVHCENFASFLPVQSIFLFFLRSSSGHGDVGSGNSGKGEGPHQRNTFLRRRCRKSRIATKGELNN